MARKSKRKVVLQLAPLDLNGKLKYRVIVLAENDHLHMDTFDLGSERSRTSFLRKVAQKAKAQRIVVDVDALEEELIKHAQAAVLGLADDGLPSNLREGILYSQVLDVFGITVLGEHDDQSIRLWSAHTKKISVIKSPANWKDAEVLQCVGEKVAERLWSGSGDKAPENTYTLTELQRALALAAANAPRISSSNIIGQGVWPHRDGYLIVDGATAHMYDGLVCKRLNSPRIDNKIIEFDAQKNGTDRSWLR